MNWNTLKESFSPSSRFNRDALWNLGSLGVLAVSGVVINFLIAGHWPKEALGVFNQVYAIYIVLSQLAVGGVHASVLRQVSYKQNDMLEASHAATAGLLLGGCLAAMVCGVGFLLTGAAGRFLDSEGVAIGLKCAVPGLFFFSLNKILLNVLNGARHMRAYAVFTSLRFAFILASVGIIILGGVHFHYLAVSLSAAEVLLFAFLSIYVRLALFPFRMATDVVARMRGHFSFGVRGFLSGLISDLNTRMDAIMLGWFSTDAVVGLYAMAATLAEGFYQFPVVIQRNVNPLLGKAFAEDDRARIEWIARRTRRVMHPLMAAIAIAAILAYAPLMRWFFPEKTYDASWAAFTVLLAGIVIQSGFAPMGGILFQGGRPGMQTVLMAIVVVVNIALNLALIPLLGINGAAIATGVAYVMQGVLTVFFAKRAFGVKLWF